MGPLKLAFMRVTLEVASGSRNYQRKQPNHFGLLTVTIDR